MGTIRGTTHAWALSTLLLGCRHGVRIPIAITARATRRASSARGPTAHRMCTQRETHPRMRMCARPSPTQSPPSTSTYTPRASLQRTRRRTARRAGRATSRGRRARADLAMPSGHRRPSRCSRVWFALVTASTPQIIRCFQRRASSRADRRVRPRGAQAPTLAAATVAAAEWPSSTSSITA